MGYTLYFVFFSFVNLRWPLILDPNGRALNWLRVLFKDRQIKIVQDWSDSEEVLNTVQSCVANGDILVLYDDACSYDSRLTTVYERAIVKKSEGSAEEDMLLIGDKDIAYSPDFKLYFISRRALQLELQTRCCVVNFTFTKVSLNEFFLDTVFEREKPAKRQEFLLICGREIEALSSSKKHREKIQLLLSETEGNVLDNANLSTSLLELRKELGKSDDRVSGMKDMKKDMKTASMQYLSAAEHATILYDTIQQLRRIDPMYQYSFDWFNKVFRSSIENSNKSNNIEKRLRYLKDHLTYSLFCQVSYSLQNEDGLIFAFLLCCKLMIKESKVPAKGLEMLIELWKVVTTEDVARDWSGQIEKYGKVPAVLNWLGQQSWEFLHEYASHFPEMKGLTNDFVESHTRWRLLFDAKEPDNLPLHEPWYSRLGRFHKLVIVATLRVDKLHELVYSFVSDHIGYKFVEPVQFDLGRIFSECDPSQPLVYTVQGPNEAVEDICKFAKEREKSLIQLSMGVKNESLVKDMIMSTLETGEKWMLLENFHNTRNIQDILRHHIRIDQDFHSGYRLWMITEPTDKFPVPELQQCLKLTSEPAGSIREALIEAFTKSTIKEAKCWSGDRQSIGGAERHMSRLLYCLAFFHASLNERCTYGAIGGWSVCPTFSDHDLTLGVHYLEMMSREFDTINFEGLCELLGHCAYANSFMDVHDRTLLETILDGCINEKAVSTNRYRFCVAVNDFFVPNKTLYKDYIEFIKVSILLLFMSSK